MSSAPHFACDGNMVSFYGKSRLQRKYRCEHGLGDVAGQPSRGEHVKCAFVAPSCTDDGGGGTWCGSNGWFWAGLWFPIRADKLAGQQAPSFFFLPWS